ncbi:hypothetical protein AGMMS49944_09470 [Spirochaetia bacterium]|nr:hypothetical protein AGMMS49944_09470 [Spirochaetia bacterium]
MLRKFTGIIVLFTFFIGFAAFAQEAEETPAQPDSVQEAQEENPQNQVTEPEKPPTPAPVAVYITRTGEKYHRGNCRYVAKSKIEVTLQHAKERGLGPCSVCKPPQ